MLRSRLAWLILIFSLQLHPWGAAPALAGPDPAIVQQLAARMGRKPIRLLRDQQRLQPLKKVTSYYELGQGKAPLTRARTKESWSPATEGPFQIKVDLANGCTVAGQAFHIKLPAEFGGPLTKLQRLVIGRGGNQIELDAVSQVPVCLARSNHFDADRGTVTWNGPTSRFELLLLSHELGHQRDFARFSEVERQAISDILDKTNRAKPLSLAEKSVLVSFERRAWAQALKTYRAHRRQGVDYLADGPSGTRPRSSEIFATVNSLLKSYYDVPLAE